jgi:hypothetical protein
LEEFTDRNISAVNPAIRLAAFDSFYGGEEMEHSDRDSGHGSQQLLEFSLGWDLAVFSMGSFFIKYINGITCSPARATRQTPLEI